MPQPVQPIKNDLILLVSGMIDTVSNQIAQNEISDYFEDRALGYSVDLEGARNNSKILKLELAAWNKILEIVKEHE